jgi:uncharacterized protein YndB with AHSA1/START domain
MAARNKAAMGEFGIHIPRHYAAPPQRVFDAWTKPDNVKAWLAQGKEISIDPREGGLFYIEMPWQERIYPHYGRYLRVEAPHVLEFTWVSEGSQGKESVVQIELTANGKGTDLVLTHDGLPDEKQAENHKGGWSGFLDQLADRL